MYKIIFLIAFFFSFSFSTSADTLGKRLVKDPEKTIEALSLEQGNMNVSISFYKNSLSEITDKCSSLFKKKCTEQEIVELFSDPQMISVLCDSLCQGITQWMKDKPFLKIRYQRKLQKTLKLFHLSQEDEFQNYMKNFLQWERVYLNGDSENKIAMSYDRWEYFIITNPDTTEPSIRNASDALAAYRLFSHDQDAWKKLLEKLEETLK